MHAGGRPTKLTDALQTAICDALRQGNYLHVACAAVKINSATLRRWLVRGAQAKRGRYAEFCEAVKEAMAAGELALVAHVQTAAPKNWQAAMTILERRHPDRWARKDFLQVQSEIRHINELPDARLRELAAQALDTLGQDAEVVALDAPARALPERTGP